MVLHTQNRTVVKATDYEPGLAENENDDVVKLVSGSKVLFCPF